MRRGIVVIALVAAPLLADDVYLRGGGQITGEIVEQTDETVTVNIGGGTMSVRMSSVVRIEKGASPIQEYRARAEKIPAGDAEAWRELARWAADEGLATLSGQAYSRVVAILPNDPEANRALGRVQLDGRWVTEAESYRAQGFVEFEGEWMTTGRAAGDPRGAAGRARRRIARSWRRQIQAERGRRSRSARPERRPSARSSCAVACPSSAIRPVLGLRASRTGPFSRSSLAPSEHVPTGGQR